MLASLFARRFPSELGHSSWLSQTNIQHSRGESERHFMDYNPKPCSRATLHLYNISPHPPHQWWWCQWWWPRLQLYSVAAFHCFFAIIERLPVVVSRRYLSICGKVISGRSSTAPYRSRKEQASAKLGQSVGPELLGSAGGAIFPGGEKVEGRARCWMRVKWMESQTFAGVKLQNTGTRITSGFGVQNKNKFRQSL